MLKNRTAIKKFSRLHHLCIAMRYFTLLLLLSAIQLVHGQDLLLNGGFEDENTCTEYQVECAPEAWISSSRAQSSYGNDSRRAAAGKHFLYIDAGHDRKPFYRSFLRTELVCPLIPGQQYKLSLQVKAYRPLLDSMGVFFSEMDPLLQRKPIHRLAPSLYFTNGNRFAPDSSWQNADLIYTASGGETYLAIAYFAKLDVAGATGLPMFHTHLISIDNVSLVPIDRDAIPCPDWQQGRERIYAENERHEMLMRSLQYRRNKPSLPLHREQPISISRREKMIVSDLFFAVGKKDLLPDSYPLLDSFCRQLKGRTIDSIEIRGHTDNSGSDEINLPLSHDRAIAVANYLARCTYLSLKPTKVSGAGSREPVDTNETTEGRRSNRRVDVILYIRQ